MMSIAPTDQRPDSAPTPSGGDRPDAHRRRWIAAAAAVLVICVAVLVAAADPFARDRSAGTPTIDSADPTGLATVTREPLSSQTEVSATLGYAGSYSIINQAQGTITELPPVGKVISEGHVLYRVDGSPVVLLYGSTPTYRSLSEGMSDSDVEQLNRDLVALGYANRSELDPTSDYFSAETAYALERLQAHLDITETGTLGLGQAVFVQAAVRVTALSSSLGTAAPPGQPIMQGTSTTRQVSIALDASDQTEVARGDHVTITLPNNQDTLGVISSVGRVATEPAATPGASTGSSPTITVLVKPADPAATGSWDQAPVNVTITTASVPDALVVPVDALLAQPNGGYAVEVVEPHDIRRLLAVALGLFDDADGLVQVTGIGLEAGQRVVVPAL